MAANRKLTPLLARRTLQSTTSEGTLLKLHFADGSVLTIMTPDTVPPDSAPDSAPSQHRAPLTVKKVRQSRTFLQLDFDDDSTLAVPLAEPTSSVMLRAANGTLEYAD
jgi:hypothetical protein